MVDRTSPRQEPFGMDSGWQPVLAAVKSLPVVGKYLLQRNIVKFSIPAIGIPLSVTINHWTTRVAGEHARKVFREEARIIETARRMTRSTSAHEELLWVLWLIIAAAQPIHENELLLLHHVTSQVGELDAEFPALKDLRETIELDQKMVWSLLERATGDLEPIYDAAVIAAVIDGNVHDHELKHLRKLAEHCSVTFDEAAIRDVALQYS